MVLLEDKVACNALPASVRRVGSEDDGVHLADLKIFDAHSRHGATVGPRQ